MDWRHTATASLFAGFFAFTSATASAQAQPGAEAQTGAQAQPGAQAGEPRRDISPAGSEDTLKFFRKAAQANLAELELARLGVQKARSPEVKQFAQEMVEAHSRAHAELKQAAEDSYVEVALPTTLDAERQQMKNELSRLSGEQFDHEFMDAMVEVHQAMADLLADRTGAAGARDLSPTSGTAVGSTPTAAAPAELIGGTTGTTGTAGTAGAATAESAEAIASGTAADSSRLLSGAAYDWASETLRHVRLHLQRATQLKDRLEDGGR